MKRANTWIYPGTCKTSTAVKAGTFTFLSLQCMLLYSKRQRDVGIPASKKATDTFRIHGRHNVTMNQIESALTRNISRRTWGFPSGISQLLQQLQLLVISNVIVCRHPSRSINAPHGPLTPWLIFTATILRQKNWISESIFSHQITRLLLPPSSFQWLCHLKQRRVLISSINTSSFYRQFQFASRNSFFTSLRTNTVRLINWCSVSVCAVMLYWWAVHESSSLIMLQRNRAET